jgi:uncharacterized membrane protein YbhN (UPF0104 family)
MCGQTTEKPMNFIVSDRDREMAEQWWGDTLEAPSTNEDFSDLWILCNRFARARAEGRQERNSPWRASRFIVSLGFWGALSGGCLFGAWMVGIPPSYMSVFVFSLFGFIAGSRFD